MSGETGGESELNLFLELVVGVCNVSFASKELFRLGEASVGEGGGDVSESLSSESKKLAVLCSKPVN